MELSAIRSILRESSQEEWHVLASGTTYRLHVYSAIEQHAFDGPVDSGIEHDQAATYRPGASLTIAWGMAAAYLDRGPQDWAPFPDENISPFALDVFWMGALVDRRTLCSVDGFRAVLPWPKFQYIPAEGDTLGVVVPPTATPGGVGGGRETSRQSFRPSGIRQIPRTERNNHRSLVGARPRGSGHSCHSPSLPLHAVSKLWQRLSPRANTNRLCPLLQSIQLRLSQEASS